MKRCTKCNTIKEYRDYHKNKKASDGLRSNCKECESESKKQYYINNKNKIREQHSIYYKNNKNSFKNRRKLYMRMKRDKDPLFKLRNNISSLIKKCLNNKGFTKNSKTCDILSCDFNTFKRHLEDNPYGLKITDNVDLDHIIPISLGKTINEVIELNHYSNFQILPSEYNRFIKKNKPFDRKDFEKYWGIINGVKI